MDDRRPPITPQLAVRVAILGGVALTLFAVVFFRLWFLQVLSGEQYLVEARENRTRAVRIQAPRGEIVDRNGTLLVSNRQAVVVQLEPQALPDAEIVAAARWGQAMTRRSKRPKGKKGPPAAIPPIPTAELRQRFRRLGRVLGMRPATIQRRAIEQLAVVPYSAVRVRSDVPRAVMSYLKERKERFPGVDVDRVYLRSYPRDTLAAQLLGYVGEISPDELKERRNRKVNPGTIIGKLGIERTYDRYLRGRDGAKVLRVDANGRFSSDRPVRRREPIPGRQLQLSLDLGLQEAGQDAMNAVAGGLPGAFVAMNPVNGEVYAMGSMPTFDPSVFAKPISQAKWAELTAGEGRPLLNRAVAGAYAAGSTFKPITSLAALDAGVITPGQVVEDTGCIKVGDRMKCNAGKVANGGVDLRRALEVSSDVYYYLAGIELFEVGDERLQRWAKALGLGRRTGVDLPEEARGLIPGKRWRAWMNRQERRCRPTNQGRACYVIDIRPYNLGDNANLAVGQGEVGISPLQMAVAYSAIATGGRVPRPHLGLEVQDATGAVVQKIQPGPARKVKIDPAHRDAILDGLARAAQAPSGTSTPVFEGWPHERLPVYGKTGTAQTASGIDQSWYVAYVPHETKPIVIAATVERGGWGADRAAPITCRMLREWFRVGAPCQGGGSNTF
ncbi:MAG TPA: penicillin-binding transpeptidase domain-containing protein [Solirubrobacteraceae bacterium]|nr:penicillin-binding transpeptidase domain-containing protein [Solirubrobacteraceae bacterium]